MNRTAVLTDTNSGIMYEEGKQKDIFVIPMPVIIDDKIYYEGYNLSPDFFYESLTGGKSVTSSQPSPGDVMEMWDRILDKGYKEIIYIPMSSGLSSSCQNAIQFSAEYDGKVQVADIHRISVTLREAVMQAVSYANDGASSIEIKELLESKAYESSIYIAVDTLEYLKRGGRVTAAGAAIGAVLNIKPILTIQGEKLDAFSKVRGMKKCEVKMLEAVEQDINTRFATYSRDHFRIGAAGTFSKSKDADQWENSVKAAFPECEVYYNALPLSIGCHVGPEAVGIGVSIV